MMLDVSEKTVYRWISERKLPGYRLSGQYRFNRAEIVGWATANRVNVSPAAVRELESEGQILPELADALQAGGIFYRIGGQDKASALRGVVEVLRLPEEVDRALLLQMLLTREQLASTAVGDGVAIPHARNPVLMSEDKSQIALGFLERPVEFGALDGKPVQALFVVLSSTVRVHLHLLSRLAFALRDAEFEALVREQAAREPLFNAMRRISGSLPPA